MPTKKEKKKKKGKVSNVTEYRDFSKAKANYLKILKANAGRIQASCEKARINRRTHYRWIEDPAFKKIVEEINESLKDFVEGKIITHIKSEDNKVSADMCKFYAKTQMKDRGYVERTELNQNIKSDNKIEVEIIEVQKKEDESPSEGAPKDS